VLLRAISGKAASGGERRPRYRVEADAISPRPFRRLLSHAVDKRDVRGRIENSWARPVRARQ